MTSLTPRQKSGNGGEEWVAQYLKAQQWRILARQWRCKWGELDIVAYREGILAFVEVKTRQSHNWDESGLLAVTARKQGKVIRAAQLFLSQGTGQEGDCRFDVALVRQEGDLFSLVEYIPGAFEL